MDIFEKTSNIEKNSNIEENSNIEQNNNIDSVVYIPYFLKCNNVNSIYNISPLRYPGGKSRACKIIESVILQHFDITKFDTIVSPFFGGGSFEFYLQNKYGVKLIVNDKFKPLYNFWKQVKLNKKILSDELYKIKSVSKEQFLNFRKSLLSLNGNSTNLSLNGNSTNLSLNGNSTDLSLNGNSTDELQQSVAYFILNRCSFSGSTLSGGFSQEASVKRFTPSSINRINLLNFNNIELHNDDFSDFLKKYTDLSANKILLFLDPPYYLEQNSKLYGINGDMHEKFDHQSLFNLLITKKNWIVTYNNCEFIRMLYKNYIIINVSWKYGMNSSKDSSEIIIISN